MVNEEMMSKICTHAVIWFGSEHQLGKVIEEVSEFKEAAINLASKVAAKEAVDPLCIAAFTEEAVDVYIMLCQLSPIAYEMGIENFDERFRYYLDLKIHKLDEALARKQKMEREGKE